MGMSLATRMHASGFTVLDVGGEVDVYSAPMLRDRITGLVERGQYQLVVDLDGVQFLDSSGLGVLVAGLTQARARGGDLRLVCTQNRLLVPFRITGLDQVFGIFATVEAAALEPVDPPIPQE